MVVFAPMQSASVPITARQKPRDFRSEAIERRISHSLSATYMLAIEVKKGKFTNFEAYSEEILNAIAGI